MIVLRNRRLPTMGIINSSHTLKYQYYYKETIFFMLALLFMNVLWAIKKTVTVNFWISEVCKGC